MAATAPADGGAWPLSAPWLVARWSLLFWGHAAGLLVVAALLGSMHDYNAYREQWGVLLAGLDPWTAPVQLGQNAYGPLHLLSAPLALLHPLLPKLLYVGAWIGVEWAVLRRVMAAPMPDSVKALLLAAAICSALVWIDIGAFGLNDALVSALLVGAVLVGRRDTKNIGMGVLIGLAGLLKFYPLLLLPFAALDRGRKYPWVIIAGGGVFAAGMLGCMAVWGDSPLAPVLFASERRARLLSLTGFLVDSAFSPVREWAAGTAARVVAALFFVVAGLSAFALHWARRLDRIDGMVLAYVVVLLCYWVGHFNFYLPLVLLLPLFVAARVARDGWTAELRRALLWFLLALGSVSLIRVLYALFNALIAPPWLVVRQNAGLLQFLLNLGLTIQLVCTIAPRAGRGTP